MLNRSRKLKRGHPQDDDAKDDEFGFGEFEEGDSSEEDSGSEGEFDREGIPDREVIEGDFDEEDGDDIEDISDADLSEGSTFFFCLPNLQDLVYSISERIL